MRVRNLLVAAILVLAYSACAHAQPLAGTSWQLMFYNNGKEAVESVAEGTAITAHFGQDGTVYGSAGCNDYTTSYSIEGEDISINRAASTRKICAAPEGIMEQEAAFFTALEKASRFEIHGDVLELFFRDGQLAASMKSTARVKKLTYRSGGTEAFIEMQGSDELYMTIEGKRYRMVSAVSASGARYVTPGDTRTEFWSKGDRAFIKVLGREYPDEFVLVSESPSGKGPAETVSGEGKNGTKPAKQLPVGAEWRVVEIAGEPVAAGSIVTMNFSRDGRLYGNASINNYMSSWLAVDDRVIIAGIASTMMAGPPELMQQEGRFLSLFEEARRFVVTDGTLVITTRDGREIVAER